MVLLVLGRDDILLTAHLTLVRIGSGSDVTPGETGHPYGSAASPGDRRAPSPARQPAKASGIDFIFPLLHKTHIDCARYDRA